MKIPPPPKFSSLVDPAAPNDGARIGVFSTVLGEPFMPWQTHAAQLVGQRYVPAPEEYQYRLFIVTVPRQAGKTTLMRAIKVDRAVSRPRQELLMTAQTGQDARKRWAQIKDRLEAADSPFRELVTVSKGIGNERIIWPNQSSLAPFAPVPKSVHGDSIPYVDVDEAWAFTADQGKALVDDAIRPAQITVPHRQLVIVSTKGDAVRSEFLNGLIRRGRAAVKHPERDPRVGFLEYSANEALAEADPAGEQTLAFHPAIGYTQRLEDIQAECPKDPDDRDYAKHLASYRRGFLNLTTDDGDARDVDLEVWAKLKAGAELPPMRQRIIGFGVNQDRTAASIWAAWWRPDGRLHLAMVKTDAGARWVPEAIKALAARRPGAIVANGQGATKAVAAGLGRDRIEVQTLAPHLWGTACETFLARLEDGTVTHDGDQALTDSLEAVPVRRKGGSRIFDLEAGGMTDPVEAAVAALGHAATTRRPPSIQLF